MVNVDLLERVCPKCKGSGRIENPIWSEFWHTHSNLKNWFRSLDLQDQMTNTEKMFQDQPIEPMFFFCKECSGKGKILTLEGEDLIKFVRFWMNDNY